MERIGASSLPIIIGIIVIYGYLHGVNVFDSFLNGAKDGLTTAIRLLPTLIGLIMAVTMLRASGLLDALCELLTPISTQLHIPSEIIPLAFLRPISGSGATAYTQELLSTHGPDSLIGQIASVMSSATETTFYAIAVYFGATKYKKLYYTVPIALLGDLTTMAVAVISISFL